ncbi:MAG: glycosyltransferase family 2 protein [Planctomycetes bacterium]|nr:glycosyltransferase family 2 protein [Planctomycetota bacterium]
MADRPRLVALVLNWRLPTETLRVLEDLRALEQPGLHTLLIDNGSGDDSAQRLQVAAEFDPNTDCLVFERNLGYCAALNRGIAWAAERGAEFVLFLNNDVRIPAGSLSPLVDVLENDPAVGAVGPTIVDTDGRAWSQGGGVAFRPNLVYLRNQGGEPAPRTAGPEEVEFLPGACALFRLDSLQRAGGLDEDYFMYWEDVDLGHRLRAVGQKSVWLPWVSIVHDPSRSSGGGRSPLRKYMMGVNTVRYLRRYGTWSSWAAFLLFECLLWPLAFVSGTGVRGAMAKGRGIVAGLLGHRITAADVDRLQPRGEA